MNTKTPLTLSSLSEFQTGGPFASLFSLFQEDEFRIMHESIRKTQNGLSL